METAPLKSFATWARTSLIREVTARIAVVLAPASPERVEQAQAVGALEKAVAAAGGGEKGRAAVADKVAYTWFNRIIALRFMDANGYTGVGVVSPQAGVGGQPEILAEAKRGNFEASVVGVKTRETLTALLNGTRRSDDAQGEAYALLLADYCRHWNLAMPFMFEREGDFTELLIPGNLLADDSVPSRAVKVLTKDVCQDVEVIGWLYQFYISERKDEVFAGFKQNKKAGADEIPAATQLFTPHWIVRYLVENSLGRLWMLNHPTSRLVDQMKYYIAPVDQETDFLKISRPEELRVVDPACGSGHMLTYAFDLLYAIYEEEGYAPAEIPALILTNNLYGTEIDPRSGALAAFALTMKARAKQRTFFNKRVEPNVCVLYPIRFTPFEIDFLRTSSGDKHAEAAFWNQFAEADTFGSLIRPDPALTARLVQHLETLDDGGEIFKMDAIESARRVVSQAEYLNPRYSVVIANPPYMGAKNMSQPLARGVRELYPAEKQDLYGCFLARSNELVIHHGLVALVIGDTWMTIKSFQAMRERMFSQSSFASFIHIRDVSNHPDIFGANTAFVLERGLSTSMRTRFVRLEPLNSAEKEARLLEAVADPGSPWVSTIAPKEFRVIPGTPIVYLAPPSVFRAFAAASETDGLGTLGDQLRIAQGITTSDNDRFLRFWWEISIGDIQFDRESMEDRQTARWVPCDKGGEFRKWYGNNRYVVDWSRDGQDLISHPGSTPRNLAASFQRSSACSSISSGAPSFRSHSHGFVFSNAAVSLTGAGLRERAIEAFCNSSTARQMLGLIAPTLNFEVGILRSLPYLIADADLDDFDPVVDRLRETAKRDWDDIEESWDFAGCSLVDGRAARVSSRVHERVRLWSELSQRQQLDERQINELIAAIYLVADEVPVDVSLDTVSLARNPAYSYGSGKSASEHVSLASQDSVKELISYGVGCMLGRYSLDEPGLILADQGATVQDYLAKVPDPTFAPDRDNVIPIVDGDWFEDDVVARFRTFLRVAFGEVHFEENLRFVSESLGVKDIRDYFVRSFYKDHVQRYKKRPIYWLFSSPKGSFNALIYMHRYTPSTVSTVLNEYLREFTAKLSSSLQQKERLAAGGGTPRQQAAAQKEADRLRKVLLELEEYEHDVLYPLASRQLAIDLDDGVKANYPKFGAALKKIPGLEAADE